MSTHLGKLFEGILKEHILLVGHLIAHSLINESQQLLYAGM